VISAATAWQVRAARSVAELAAARDVERGVFRACGYADISDYDSYDEQSSVFGAFAEDARCSGMIRLVGRGEHPLPVLQHMQLDDPELWQRRAAAGRLDEVATVAVLPEHRDGRLFLDLMRLGYRDARSRGVGHVMIITEPDRVTAMNRDFHLRFVQVGPYQHFRGEVQVTAPFAVDLDAQDRDMQTCWPEYLTWFRDTPFDASVPSPLWRS
jgi:hypothetical protein